MEEQEVIALLNLVPLPSEGGFYRQTFKSNLEVDVDGYRRAASTAIYFLVTADDFSALHRVKHDEVFHFYAGDPVKMIQISPSGKLSESILGGDLRAGQLPQVVVPRNVWQACRVVQGGRWALLGCTVAPGFEFEDFELGQREDLVDQWPEFRAEIEHYTRAAN
jgi:predicted cupin superfamily sugar epimerase